MYIINTIKKTGLSFSHDLRKDVHKYIKSTKNALKQKRIEAFGPKLFK